MIVFKETIEQGGYSMIFALTLSRMLIFFIIFFLGFVAGKSKTITPGYLPELAKLIANIFLPVMIFYSTYANCTRQTILENWMMVLLAALFYAFISLLMFCIAKAMHIPHDKDRVFQMCFIFGNTGFVGVPLLAAVFPDAGLVYMMMFSIVDQLAFWTYGVWLSTARDHGHPAKHHMKLSSLLTPNTVAIVLAVAFVMAKIPLPDILDSTLDLISSSTSALCMMYLGALACFAKVSPVLKRPELYVGIGVKMVLLPILIGKSLLSLSIVPANMVYALAMIMALPVMTVVPMVVAANGREADYATGITVITLVASIATIPFVVFCLQ